MYMHGPNTGHKVTVGGEFGHEMVSVVSQVGCKVKDIKIGDRVYPYPRLVKGDTKRAGTVGGFSEYVLAPNAKLNEGVYLVPENISDKAASLIEPFTVGCRAARRSFPKFGENAIVFGCGTIGIAAAMALKYFGCKQVLIADVSEFRLNIAKNLGFGFCFDTGAHQFKEKPHAKSVAKFKKRLTSFGLVSMLDYYTERCVTC